MRRKNFGNRIVKKAITWAMIVMMSFSGSMSGFASMTVYAEKVSNSTDQAEESEDTAGNQSQDAAIEVIGNTNKTEETYVDNELVVDAPDTENNEITEAQTNNQLDHTKIETTVEKVDTHYVIENSNGNIIGQDQNGNEVKKIEVNAEGTEVNTVKVIEKETDPNADATQTPAIEVVDEEKIIYGHFENDVFVEGSKNEKGNSAYTLTDGTYKETTTVNVVKGIDGETGENRDYFVKDEVVDVLKGKTVKGYEKKTVYYVEGTEIPAEDIDTVLEGNNYSIEEDTGILIVEATEKQYITYTTGNGHNKIQTEVDITGKTVEIEGKSNYILVKIDGVEYPNIDSDCFISNGKNPELKPKTQYSITIDGETKTLNKDQVETRKTYQVTDSNNNVLCEVDATAKDYIEKRNYTKVNDMYVVKDKDNKDVYFTPQEWEIVTSKEVTYKEVTRYYYTSESKYEGKHFDITFRNDEDSLEYSLDINFWNGEYVKLDPDNVITYSEDDGNIIVSIPYLYAEDYELTEDAEWKKGVFTRKISKSEFGVSRIATLNVKYEPVLSRAEKVTFKAEIVTETVEGETQGSTIVTEERNTTESATLGDAQETLDKTEIPVKVFVRLDNEKPEENGSTHYGVGLYTKDLTGKYNTPLYLGYTTEGYQVHDNNLDGSTATEKIYTKLAGEMFEENLRKLANLYIANEKSAQVQEYVGGDKFKSDIQKQIADAQKKAIEDDSELQDENGTIEWSYTVGGKTVDSLDEAIKLAKELVVDLSKKDGAGVNWYVLKKENDGWHIDGVCQIPNVTITVQGKFVSSPSTSPSVSPSTSPSVSPSTTPSVSPSTTPSVSPSTTPSVSPSTTPSVSPSTTPSVSPSTTPSVSPSTTPSASPSTTPSTSPEATTAPTTTPGGGTAPTGGGDTTPDDGGAPTVIIPDEPVALAAAPVDNAPADDAAVLGARRVDGDTTDAAVLGAKRGTEQAVLGKRRKPKTGDSAALSAWMAAMTMATGAAGVSGTKLARRKKKEEKED